MIKIRQIGLNIIIAFDKQIKTITVPKDYDVNILFTLVGKIHSDIKVAEKLFWKEVAKFEKPVLKDTSILEARINRKKINKAIKKIQSFDYSKLPVFIPDEWISLIQSKEDSSHIENFLMWLSLCDSEYTRNNFLKSFDTKYCYITPSGLIASLRQVYLKDTNDPLYDFIQSKWKYVKTVFKKSPKKYVVVEGVTNQYNLSNAELWEDKVDGKSVGNLDDLYHNYKPLKKSTYISRYCKEHPEIHQEEWSIGDVVTMPNKATHGEICGLHQYHILQNPLDVITEKWGTYGDTIILVLVNPARLISIREGWKYTTDQFYFSQVMDKSDVEKQFNEQWGLFDFDYLEESIEDIKASVVKGKTNQRKLDKVTKIKFLQEVKKKLILGNKADHIEPVLYDQILKNRINLI